ncbi:MAG: trigger factor [Acidimicrobiia bacterium]
MDTTIKQAGPFERLVTLHLAEEDLERAKDQAARRLSKRLKIKGFRPGKAPRRVVEATVGTETLRSEAIEEALPGALTSFLREAELVPATSPRVEGMRDTAAGVEVDVKVTLFPRLETPPPYRDRKIRVGSPEVTEADVASQIERLRDQFAELEGTPRPAQEGDYVSVDLAASRHGEPVEEASAADLLYEVGSHSLIPGLDEQLVNRKAGDIVRFNATLPAAYGDLAGTEVTIQVLVKDVRRKTLPTVTDEWVSEVSEFESLAELRERLAENLAGIKRAALRAEFRARVLEELLEEVDLVLPEALVGLEMERVLHRVLHDLEGRGVTVDDYLAATGETQEHFVERLRREAERNLTTTALLEAVVEAEGLEVNSQDVDQVITSLAEAAERDPEEYRRALRKGKQEDALASDILRQRAFEALVAGAVPVDEEGDPVDLEPRTEPAGEVNEE